MDPGILGAASLTLFIVLALFVGWLLERRGSRREERLDRLEQRRAWRQDWAVDAGEPIVLNDTRSRQRDQTTTETATEVA